MLSTFEGADGQITETSTISSRASGTVQGDPQKSAGHVIGDTLVAHGIKGVHVVPGESFLDVLDELHGAWIETIVWSGSGEVRLTSRTANIGNRRVAGIRPRK